jgi:spermidine synthase
MRRSYNFLRQTFNKKNYLVQHFMPSYPSGWWITGFASKKFDPLKTNFKNWNSLKISTKFFNEEVYFAGFCSRSQYLKNLIKDIK